MTEQQDVRIKRLRYQSWHRGCKETDVILGTFCDRHLEQMSGDELSVFERFLEEDDHDIWQWVAYGKTPPSPNYLPLIEKLKHHAKA